MDRSYDYLIWFIDLRFRPIRFQDQILAIFSKLHLPVIGRTDNGFESLILLQGREGSEPQRINYSLLLLLPAPQVSNLKPEIFWREKIYIVFLIMLGNTVAPPPESSLYFTPYHIDIELFMKIRNRQICDKHTITTLRQIVDI